MQNPRLDEAQAGIKIAGRNINNLRYAKDTTLTEEKWTDSKLRKEYIKAVYCLLTYLT